MKILPIQNLRVKAVNYGNGNITLDAAANIAIEAGSGVVMMAGLPTSDPSNAGQLWNDSNTLKISAG